MEYKIAELNLDFLHHSLINLIKNAIEGEATSIAIRIDTKFRRIQIVDNGIGFPLNILRNIGEYKAKTFYLPNKCNHNDYNYSCHQNYRNIIKKFAELLKISTKYKTSNECYEKLLKNGLLSQIQKMSNRSTHGTTSTIYFTESTLENHFHMTIFTTSVIHLAKNYPQISFSIRDDNKQEIILQIKKKFKQKLEKKKYSLHIDTNLSILPLISASQKKSFRNSENTNKISLFKYTLNQITTSIELPNNATNSAKLQSRKIEKLPKSPEKLNFDNEIVPSQWSDWNLESLNNKYEDFQQSAINTINVNEKRRYKFLPAKLTTLLPLNTNEKLVNRRMTQEFNTCDALNHSNYLPRRQDFDVRLCNINKMQHLEITLERDSLKQMEVLNQINCEFIAATVSQNGRKLLILIDQHAMHERIRYENLLKEYKNNENQLTSVKLERFIKIHDLPMNICELILKNSKLFINFGIELQPDPTTNTKIIIKTIPTCFSRRKMYNLMNLIAIIRELLLEIIDKLIEGIGFNNLPLIIHNAIASEACHGAIKFGDPLNFHQCNIMVDYWKQTNLPNRCAHGRPVIIPLLSIDIK